MSSDEQRATSEPSEEPSEAMAVEPPRRSRRTMFLVLIAAIIALDVAAFVLIPPYPKEHPGEPVSGIADLISANIELPAPHVLLGPDHPPAGQIVVLPRRASRTRSSRAGS